jgi:protein TonB
MFEDSLVESRVVSISTNKRWTALASISLQFAVAAIVIMLPLLHPEALPFHEDVPKLLLPLPPKPPVPVVHAERASAISANIATASAVRAMVAPNLLPSREAATDPPPLAPIGSGMGMRDGIPDAIGSRDGANGPIVTLGPSRATGLLHVSLGVSQGMLIAPIRPVYPAIAKAAHVEGTVIVEAIISRTGTIESLHVISGPPMLQRAAIDAIQAARYQPYRLNGVPTEVQTTFSVNFRMGG